MGIRYNVIRVYPLLGDKVKNDQKFWTWKILKLLGGGKYQDI